MSPARRPTGVVGGLLLLTAGAAWLILALLDQDGGPPNAAVEPMPRETPHANDAPPQLSAAPVEVPAAPTLRGRTGTTGASTQPETSAPKPAPTAAAQLTLRDESGKPAAGVSVTVEASGWSGTTGSAGTLQLPEAASTSKVRVAGAGFESVELLRPTGPTTVVLAGTEVVAGRVLHGDDSAAAGATVSILRLERTRGVPDRPEWTTVTGGDGGFRLARLPPGDWVVRASLKPPHDGFALEAAETCVLPGAHDLVLRLDRSREIHGHITGPGGTPPPKKLNVVMRGVRPDGGNGDVWSGTVAADGTFVIRHVGSGANMLWAWTTDAASNLALTILHDVPPGTRDLQVTLKTGGVIEGSLVDACGEPVKGGGWLYAYDGDVLVNGANLPKAGSFRSYLLPRDRVYDVTLLSASGWTGTVRGVAAGTSGLVVQGRRLPPLTGIVLLPDGSRAGAGVQVQAKAVGISADRRPGTAVHVSTDAQGRFSIPKLADFRYVVTARATSDYAPARAPGTVRPGDEVQLDLRPAERLSGRVIRANSLPAAKSTVWVVPEDAAFAGWPMKTDDDGRFALETLPAGRVRLMVDTLDGAVEVGRATVPAEEVVLTLPDR